MLKEEEEIMKIRKYNKETDEKALEQVAKEVGWNPVTMKLYVEEGRELVAEVDGRVEAFCSTSSGNIQYLDEQLSFSEIGTVAASLLVRKQKISGTMTALKIVEDAEAGAAVCALGMFDQGYYDKMGFGTGSYTLGITFPLKALMIKGKARVPKRLTSDDFLAINNSLQKRMRAHGSFTCTPDLVKGIMKEGGLGLGYYDAKGELTHHIWFSDRSLEEGPLRIFWWSYQNLEQLKELLQLIKSFEDQIASVKIKEIPFIRIQDFIERPYHHAVLSEKSPHQYRTTADADWQMRILDLEACLEKTKLPISDLSFNLKLADPIEKFLINEDVTWKGITGEYTITLGKESSARKGLSENLPTLEASVGAFSRLWFGCATASELAFSSDLKGNNKLIENLDKAFASLPKPKPNHPF